MQQKWHIKSLFHIGELVLYCFLRVFCTHISEDGAEMDLYSQSMTKENNPLCHISEEGA